MTERDMENVLTDMLSEVGEVDIGFGPVRVVHATAFGSRMLTLNRGVTLEVEWEEEVDHENIDSTGPKVETFREKFQLVVHKA